MNCSEELVGNTEHERRIQYEMSILKNNQTEILEIKRLVKDIKIQLISSSVVYMQQNIGA
jgi:hypothetical protein